MLLKAAMPFNFSSLEYLSHHRTGKNRVSPVSRASPAHMNSPLICNSKLYYMMFKITRCIFLGNLLIKYYMAKNCCKMNLNLSTTYADVQRIDRLLTNGLNLSSKMCSITICRNFISLRCVAIQGMKIYTGNLFVLPELL